MPSVADCPYSVCHDSDHTSKMPIFALQRGIFRPYGDRSSRGCVTNAEALDFLCRLLFCLVDRHEYTFTQLSLDLIVLQQRKLVLARGSGSTSAYASQTRYAMGSCEIAELFKLKDSPLLDKAIGPLGLPSLRSALALSAAASNMIIVIAD